MPGLHGPARAELLRDVAGANTAHVPNSGSRDRPETPPADWPELWLDDLLVDGRLLRFDSTERSVHWAMKQRRGSGLPSNLQYKGGLEPATLEFTAASFVLVAKARAWSGTIEVQSENRARQTLDVQAPAFQEQVIAVAEPVTPLSVAVLMAAAVSFTLLAWAIAPWRNDRRALIWLIFFLAVFHAMFWATQPVGTTNDSRSYVAAIQDSIVAGQPSLFPPGYPAFLGVIAVFSGENLSRWTTFVQHALAVVTACWTYSTARRLVHGDLALLCGVLAGAASPIITLSQCVMSEIPTVFAMAGALYFGVRASETAKFRFALLAGALTGYAGLTRGVPLLALLPAIALLQFSTSAANRFRLAATTVGVAAGVMLLPVAWFAYHTGQPALVESTGGHLYDRVVTEQKQLDANGPATRILMKLLEGQDLRRLQWWEVAEQLESRELPPEYDADELLTRVSREGILMDPLAFLSYTPGLAWRELLADPQYWIPPWGETYDLDSELESPPLLPFTASSLLWRRWLDDCHAYVWPVLCWVAVAGALVGLFRPQRALVLTLTTVPLIQMLASASLEMYVARYNVPAIPFVSILAVVPLSFLLVRRTAIDQQSPPGTKPIAATEPP